MNYKKIDSKKMKYNLLIPFLILNSLFLINVSCSEKKKTENRENKFFNLKKYFEKESQRLDKQKPKITKFAKLNDLIDTLKTKEINWKSELEIFANADINKPAWQDSYKIDTIKKENNILKISYLAKNEELAVKEILLKKQANKIAEIKIKTKNQNILFENQQELIYFPDSLIIIKGSQDLIFSSPNDFKIRIEF